MTATTQELQARLDALDEVIASGALTVEYQGKKTTYRSHDDLLKARQMIVNQMAAGGTPTSRATYCEFDGGC